MSTVEIEVSEAHDSNRRRIGPDDRLSESFSRRSADIEDCIRQAIVSAEKALPETSPKRWSAAAIELKFGIKVIAESGVIIAKAGGEASIEVSLTLTRGPS